MRYNAIKAGKLQDYIEHNDGSYTEVWELEGEIYFCVWLPFLQPLLNLNKGIRVESIAFSHIISS